METRQVGRNGSSSLCVKHFHPAILASVLVLSLVACEKKEAAAPPSPPDVKVADVVQQDVPVYSEWVAQLNGDTNAQIMPKVQGYVLRQNYKDGFPVKIGAASF